MPEPVGLEAGREARGGLERGGGNGSTLCVLQRTGPVLVKDSQLPRKTILWAQLPCPAGLKWELGGQKGREGQMPHAESPG